LPNGCTFAPRCEYVIEACTIKPIPLLSVNDEHQARCIRFDKIGDEAAKTTMHKDVAHHV
jgi:peptide/nickel transport system ATP-binding protein